MLVAHRYGRSIFRFGPELPPYSRPPGAGSFSGSGPRQTFTRYLMNGKKIAPPAYLLFVRRELLILAGGVLPGHSLDL